MKTRYLKPQLLIVKINSRDGLLLGTSETTVTGNRGGWVKEDVADSKSLWDE